MDALIPVIEFTIIGLPILFALVRRMPPAERELLLRTALLGFALRLAVSSIFVLVPETRVFHEDASGYELGAQGVAAAWHGDGPPIPLRSLMSATGYYPAFLIVCSSLYYVFGTFQMVVTAFTSLCGAVTIILVYRLTARSFHQVVAQRAATLTAFFPSMVLWSAMALKDPLMMMLIVITLNCAASMRSRFNVPAAILLVASLLAVYFIRFYIAYVLLLAVVVSLLIPRGSSVVGTFYRQLAIVVVLLTLMSAFGLTSRLTTTFNSEFSLERMSAYRYGMAITANSGFSNDVDVSTPSRALAFLPIGASELLFGPFPWQMTSLRPLLTLPEMLVWWSMIPALWRGLRFALRKQFGNIVPIFVFGVTLLVLYSLTLGNVGAAFRQRAQVFIFLFIFAAVGKYVAVCKQRGIDTDLLIVGKRVT